LLLFFIVTPHFSKIGRDQRLRQLAQRQIGGAFPALHLAPIEPHRHQKPLPSDARRSDRPKTQGKGTGKGEDIPHAPLCHHAVQRLAEKRPPHGGGNQDHRKPAQRLGQKVSAVENPP